jgi:L-aspartate oxidase
MVNKKRMEPQNTQPALPRSIECDYLVIGTGIAGLYFALNAAAHGRVLMVSKERAERANTWLAQGGIAAVLSAPDSFAAHCQDTLRVGVGLCCREAVETAVQEGPQCIADLVQNYGVEFDRNNAHVETPKNATPSKVSDDYDLGREGGHSHRRVVHYRDVTGRAVADKLLEAARRHSRIQIFEDCMAVDLLSRAKYGGPPGCFGAYVLDRFHKHVSTVTARVTVLACGGAGKVYLYTSNVDGASGDGIAMAYRLGATVQDMEFIQFHPTCLYHPAARSFLISEALRGEGGKLILADGTRFMPDVHPDGELAPRDVVARAIDHELKRTGDDCVYLDMTALEPAFLKTRFPNIYKNCLSFGIDITREPIPVVPAAHYICGGVRTDVWGRTDVPNLLAIGETACTGLHGACRLASNSLLEGLVFGRRAAQIAQEMESISPGEVAHWSPGGAIDSDEAVVVSHNWDEIRRFMWNYVGIVRSTKRLQRALRRIDLIREEIREYYWNFNITTDLLELRNLALVAHLIVATAISRPESRGLHHMRDHTETRAELACPIAFRRGAGPPPK